MMMAKPGSGWRIALRLLEFGPSVAADFRMVIGGGRERRCTQCSVCKPLTEFPTDGVNKDGSARWRARCRECQRIIDASKARSAYQRKTATRVTVVRHA